MTLPQVDPALLLTSQATHSQQAWRLKTFFQRRMDTLAPVFSPFSSCSLTSPASLLSFVEPSLPSQASVKCSLKEAAYLFHAPFRSAQVGPYFPPFRDLSPDPNPIPFWITSNS